jgi:hypothetical protein
MKVCVNEESNLNGKECNYPTTVKLEATTLAKLV